MESISEPKCLVKAYQSIKARVEGLVLPRRQESFYHGGGSWDFEVSKHGGLAPFLKRAFRREVDSSLNRLAWFCWRGTFLP